MTLLEYEEKRSMGNNGRFSQPQCNNHLEELNIEDRQNDLMENERHNCDVCDSDGGRGTSIDEV